MKWKKIQSTNNEYEASEHGDVRRVGGWRDSLKPKQKKNGYYEVVCCVNKTCKSRYVHRLVAEAFFGEIPKDKEVHHKDEDKSNNCINNLELIYHHENMKKSCLFGEGHPNSKATTEIVKKIRKIPLKQAYKDFPFLSTGCIYAIKKRNSWKHI